ncbi:MAG TPA: hypothetical protein VIO94_07510 [Phenylobacterium sp.]
MAKAQGARTDETAQPSSQESGPEKWLVIAMVVLALVLVGALLAFAGGGQP